MKKKNVSEDVIFKTYDIVLVVSLVCTLFSGVILFKSGIMFFTMDVLAFIFTLITLILVKKRHKYTSFIGLLAGIFLFFTRSILGILVGILLIYNSIRLEKYIK